MVYAAGSGPAIGRYPDWSPELALEVMDRFEIATALTSLAQPGVQFCKPAEAKTLARRCNDYAAELNASTASASARSAPSRCGTCATRWTRSAMRSTR